MYKRKIPGGIFYVDRTTVKISRIPLPDRQYLLLSWQVDLQRMYGDRRHRLCHDVSHVPKRTRRTRYMYVFQQDTGIQRLRAGGTLQSCKGKSRYVCADRRAV